MIVRLTSGTEMFRRSLITIIVITFLVQAQPSKAQFSLTTNSTVGLDEPTIRMVNGLPQEVKDQILDLMTKALPMIKADIDAYIKEANESVEKQILNVQCAAYGIAADYRTEFQKIFIDPGGPVAQFRKDEATALKRLKESSPPQSFADVYADLHHEAAVMYCQMHISTADQIAVQIENQYRRQQFIWLSLVNQCNDANGCMKTLRQRIKTLVNNSEERDVKLVGASSKLAKVPDPDKTVHFYTSFDAMPFNAALTQLFDIQTEITAAKARRALMASEKTELMKSKLTEMEAEIAQALNLSNPVHSGICQEGISDAMIAQANAHANQAVALQNDASALLEEAERLSMVAALPSETEYRQRTSNIFSNVTAVRNAKAFVRMIPDCGVH
jgi:hypothetical protein